MTNLLQVTYSEDVRLYDSCVKLHNIMCFFNVSQYVGNNNYKNQSYLAEIRRQTVPIFMMLDNYSSRPINRTYFVFTTKCGISPNTVYHRFLRLYIVAGKTNDFGIHRDQNTNMI